MAEAPRAAVRTVEASFTTPVQELARMREESRVRLKELEVKTLHVRGLRRLTLRDFRREENAQAKLEHAEHMLELARKGYRTRLGAKLAEMAGKTAETIGRTADAIHNWWRNLWPVEKLGIPLAVTGTAILIAAIAFSSLGLGVIGGGLVFGGGGGGLVTYFDRKEHEYRMYMRRFRA